MHYTFLVAFTVIGTSIVFVNDNVRSLLDPFGVRLYFYYGDFYLLFKAAMDTFFVLIILGATAAAIRRAVVKPTLLDHPAADKLRDYWETRLGYWLPMTLLMLVPLTGLMLEGARINANPPNFTEWAYVGRNIAKLEGAARCRPTVPSLALAVPCDAGIRPALLLAVHETAPLPDGADKSLFPQPGRARTAGPDQGFRECRDFRRRAGRAVFVEAVTRYGFVSRMLTLHDQLPHGQHGQNAQP
jgi:hypothetical protein